MYSTLVDGGVINGVTIPAIGLEKAFYIYSTTELLYQDPYTGNAPFAIFDLLVTSL